LEVSACYLEADESYMAGFFELVGHQIDEVERIQQRCAHRVKRFTAFGTLEQSRGVTRQLNEAIGAARALLKTSLIDSRLDIDVSLARHAISSVGAPRGCAEIQPHQPRKCLQHTGFRAADARRGNSPNPTRSSPSRRWRHSASSASSW
jgi:hypothetical protein